MCSASYRIGFMKFILPVSLLLVFALAAALLFGSSKEYSRNFGGEIIDNPPISKKLKRESPFFFLAGPERAAATALPDFLLRRSVACKYLSPGGKEKFRERAGLDCNKAFTPEGDAPIGVSVSVSGGDTEVMYPGAAPIRQKQDGDKASVVFIAAKGLTVGGEKTSEQTEITVFLSRRGKAWLVDDIVAKDGSIDPLISAQA